MHIVIDARIINTSTGRYVERLLTYLQNIDTSNQYTILVPTKDRDFWKPATANFTVMCVDIKNYTVAEQVEYKRILDSLRADLVHFCMPQQPVLYSGAKVTTIHDLTLLNTWNSDKNWLVYHLKQLVGRFVFHHVVKTSARIITDSNNSRDDVISFDGRAKDKISTVYLAAETSHN
ncbi:glycosyl transferase family 1, partial [Candidatus Saccharibacteria bacterium 32-49-10]